MDGFSRRDLLRMSAVGGIAAASGVAGSGMARGRVIAGGGSSTPPAYLTDLRAPIPDEASSTALVVEGRIPSELSGRYVRNGPNPAIGYDPGNWWSGAGMLHGVRLRGGRAEWYRNRWVRTVHEPPTNPDGSRNLRSGPANTSVRHHAGRIFALVEACLPYEVTPDLSTVGPVDFGGRLTTAMTAHPKVSPITGEMHFFGYGLERPYVTYHRLSPAGELVRSVPIDLPEAILMHDFAITENHVIWLDLPMVWQPGHGESEPAAWSERHTPRLGVMPLDGTSSDIRWFTVSPRWAWHVANAHEDRSGRIVVEAITGDGPTWNDYRRYFAGVAGARVAGHLYRWTLDPHTGRVSEQVLDDLATEFPTINDDHVGADYRFVYSPTTPISPTRHNRVVKHDLRTGRDQAHYLGPHHVSGEAVFVPAKDASDEDDGWLISVVHDLTRPAASLMIFDASALDRRPVATIHLPRRVPYGFHGAWLPDDALIAA